MDWIDEESGVAYGTSPEATKAHRVLSDHGRGMTFLVAEGVTPSNEGRGYVLRRLIRRSVVQARRIGLAGRLPRCRRIVVEQVGPWYPEVVEHAAEIERVVRAEEERFRETLERGMKEFDELARPGDIGAEDAFRLAATYGFPIELTVELAEERGQRGRRRRLPREMEQHREISRGTGREGPASAPPTSRAPPASAREFVGYAKTEVLTQLGALEELGDGTFLAKLRESPFYPAGGGQVTDHGWIELDDDARRPRRAGRGVPLRGRPGARSSAATGFAAGDRVRAVVPWAVRFPTMANHTGDPPPARGAPRGARRPRQAGRLRGAAGQASLRLHAPARADARGARARRADRQRADLREPSACTRSRRRSTRRATSGR